MMTFTLKCKKSGYSARFIVDKNRDTCQVEDFDPRGYSLGYPRTTDIADGRKLWNRYANEFGYVKSESELAVAAATA